MQVTNRIILGTVQFGLDYGINNQAGKPSAATVSDILNTAFDNGIDTLDTAEAYGNAHEVIGNFHAANPTKIFKIITKLPHAINGNNISKKIDQYLEGLRVPHIEALLFHSYDTYKRENATLIQLVDLKKSGLIKHIGVSVYTNDQLQNVINDDTVDIVQLPFNLFDNFALRGPLLEQANKKGKVIHTRSAFLQGLFFAYVEGNHTPVVQKLKEELYYIKELSSSYSIPMQKLALSYCISQPLINNVMIGVDNLQQLTDNIADATFRLPHKLVEEITAITVKDPDLLNPSLWNQIKL